MELGIFCKPGLQRSIDFHTFIEGLRLSPCAWRSADGLRRWRGEKIRQKTKSHALNAMAQAKTPHVPFPTLMHLEATASLEKLRQESWFRAHG
jgi:hypothetical protein